jgi:hypothetical protein
MYLRLQNFEWLNHPKDEADCMEMNCLGIFHPASRLILAESYLVSFDFKYKRGIFRSVELSASQVVLELRHQ